MLLAVALGVTAVAFVFVCGANDGGALLVLAIRHRRRLTGLALIPAVALAAGPALFGLGVAHTFTGRLVGDGGQPRVGQAVFLGGAAAAVGLVLLLTARGIPTSITLAILGGLAGAGTGLGVPPEWGRLGLVLGIAALAPFVGAAAGFVIGRLARLAPAYGGMARLVDHLQLAAFGGQCLAYAANDGQKMFAVVTVATAWHVTGRYPSPGPAVTIVIALVFMAGAVFGLRRVGRGAATTLLPPRPWHVVSAEVASSIAVLSTAGLGMPVSMTQSVAGGLAGAGASEGGRRVRWQSAVPLMTAWLVTLPAGYAAGLLAGLLLRGVS